MPRVNWDRVVKGDIFLRRTSGPIGYLIRRYSKKILKKQRIKCNKVWSNHTGIFSPIVDPDGNEGRYFIEATKKGVVISPFSKYEKCKNMRIFAFVDKVYRGKYQNVMIHDFVEYALAYQGAGYDFWQNIGILAHALAPGNLEIAWDDEWRMICSELVGKSALKAGFPPFFPLKQVRKAHLVPEHIILSKITRERTEVYL